MTDFDGIRSLLRRRAQCSGERPAVVPREVVLNYREMAARASAASEELLAAGIGSGVQVALGLPNSVDYVAWFFGILEAGGVAVPLSPSAAPAEREALCEEGGIGWIVAPPGPRLRKTRFVSRPVTPAPDAQGDIVVRQFSSGSTGRPRVILRTGAQLCADAVHYSKTLGIGPDDRFLGVAPFNHAYGGLSFLAAFPGGASVSVLSRFLPGPVLEMARRYGPTFFLATPPMIDVLGICALGPGDQDAFRTLRYCICSGGPLEKRTRDAFVDRFGVPIRVQYGSTETLAATIDLDDGFEEGRVGRPFEGVIVHIFSDGGKRLPPGTPGAVGIQSDAACDGYANDPTGTAERFRGGYVFPGDQGVLDEGGVLRLRGRSDIVNVGGLKVDPVEVANVIRSALPVSAVEVFGGERAGIPAVFAVVEADPGHVTPAMVIGACKLRLSLHKVPSRVEVVKCLPRDGSGKVPRARLETFFC